MMRVWGRVAMPVQQGLILGGPGVLGGPAVAGPSTLALKWVDVTTDSNGNNDYVYITALIQCLKLSIGESPFWSDWGIPAKRSIVQQVFPDYYVTLMQQRYAKYFASLQITKVNSATPTYNIYIITNQGVVVNQDIPV
jgi:hypothetical protein